MTPTLANLSTITIIMSIPTMLSALFFFAVAIAGFAGVYFALSTRADAFDAADRQNKNTWALILGGSALVCLLHLPFIMWFGAVAIGVYWLDVKPQLDNILRGNYGY